VTFLKRTVQPYRYHHYQHHYHKSHNNSIQKFIIVVSTL